MRIRANTKHMNIFQCLSSETRIKVLELLAEKPRSVGELAKELGVSSAIMTRHISMLEEVGIINCIGVPGKRGLKKECSLKETEILISIKKEGHLREYHTVSIPVGQYVSYEVQPTCGMASVDGYIGLCDDQRYFSNPDRVKAAILWFQSGFVEYCIPGYIVASRTVHSIEITMEICSEYPVYKEDWPSDIYFYINGVFIGYWTSPGDFGAKRGVYTPEWWRATQYGLLKTIRITQGGSFLDGMRLSDITLEELNIQSGKDILFRISAPSDAKNPGGVNIFGKGFGNYDQDIEVRIEYE